MLAQLPVLELAWVDGSGSYAETHLTVGSMLDVGTIDAAAIELIAAVSAMSGAVIIRYDIVYKFVQATSVAGSGTSDKLRNGVFIFDCSDVGEIGLIAIPSVKEALFVTSGPGAAVLIDTSDADVTAFVSVVEDGIFTNPFASDLHILVAAYRQSRV